MSALLALSAILYSLVPLSSACPSTMILISGYNSNQEACLSSIAFASSSKLVEFVAKNINSNIRELEGAIISLIAQSSFNKAEITVELAKEVINKFVKNNRREVSIDYIQKVVSDYFQMDIQTLQSKTRKRHIVQARQIAMYFAKKFTKASLASIGTQIGRRDHATVLHACKTVDNLIFTDKQFRK